MPVFHQGFLGCINRMISCTIKYIICYMRGDKGQDEEIEGIIPDYIWKDGLCGAVYGHTGGNPVWRLPVAGRVHAHCIRHIHPFERGSHHLYFQ